MNETIGSILRKYRLKAGLSKVELARRVGVDRELITRWETGVTENISLPYLVRIMKALNVQVKITFMEGEVTLEEERNEECER